MNQKRNKIIFYGIIGIMLAIGFLFQGKSVSGLGMHDYYGGRINKVTYCTCYYDFGLVLEIQDKSRNNQTVKVFYSPYMSRLRANYNIWYAGPNVIGGYTMGSHQCKNTKGYVCTNSGTTADGIIDWIRGIGSSSSGF